MPALTPHFPSPAPNQPIPHLRRRRRNTLRRGFQAARKYRNGYLTSSRDGKQGEKAYAVLQRAMSEDKVVGLAQVLISYREQLVLLRPVGRLLTMSVLHYDASVRPAATFDDGLPEAEVSTAEVKLAKTLIDVTRAKDPSLDVYRNLYNERLEALVQAKISGQEIATAPSEERGPPVINIMDALKASLEKTKPRRPGAGRIPPGGRAKAPAEGWKSG